MTDYTTKDYSVEVVTKDDTTRVYQVLNTALGVVEYEDYLLPRVIDTMAEMQTRLDEARQRLAGPIVPHLSAVGGKKDGEPTH